MTVTAAGTAGQRRRGAAQVLVLLLAFGSAVALRVEVGGLGAARSPTAGLVFAAALAVLVVAGAGSPVRLTGRTALAGLGGAAVLLTPVLLSRLLSPLLSRMAGDGGTSRPGGSFLAWGVVVAVVAAAEEAFLRGTLHRRVEEVAGPGVAVAVGAVAFAALHVPLYGWGAAPLDLAVGCWLGWLRVVTGGWAAPALAHIGADLAAWWLR